MEMVLNLDPVVLLTASGYDMGTPFNNDVTARSECIPAPATPTQHSNSNTVNTVILFIKFQKGCQPKAKWWRSSVDRQATADTVTNSMKSMGHILTLANTACSFRNFVNTKMSENI